jgi:UDP-N-acetylglucosamine:LPS N-acetylglucosamine transferase
MMHENHLLIGKAGGATVQETIAAKCPMIITTSSPVRRKATPG